MLENLCNIGENKMVKDKIMQMDNGKSYYVLEDVEYNGKKLKDLPDIC